MHTGVISFCDRIAYNIKSSDTKDDILMQIAEQFQIHILQRHWHRLDEPGLAQLCRSPHFACLRSNGNPYFMYFTKYEDVPIIYYIDKKIQPGYQKPRIILGRGKFDESLFENTMFDGEMVKDIYGEWVFLVNDVIAYKNEYLWKKTLPERIEYAYEVFSEHYSPDPVMDVCKFHVKKYAHATQEGIQALLEFSESLPYTSRGIYLWPFSRKFKPKLYNFDDSLIKMVTRKVKDNPEFREDTSAGTNTCENIDAHTVASDTKSQIPDAVVTEVNALSDELILWLRKTEYPDVYDVYSTNHGMAQNTKVGIAHVPTLQVSKWLRNEFKNTTVAIYIPFKCKKHDEFDKWVPLQKINVDA